MSLIAHKEQRQEPRYDCHFTAQVTHQGEPVPASLVNLSQSGLRLACPQSLYESLAPDIQFPDRRAKLRLDVEFQLAEGEAPVRVHCSVAYYRRQAQNCYLLGCHVVRYLDNSDGRIRDTVTRLARGG
ncbi:PilZ domain-containing protein [Ferrimonas balearica]|uniref:PilZ domain-containing protein n=1 Tax=Ferrimonas balearica TaxID=44012 RepID=UPI001C995D58|nr:PilZ domain-containing protein [Ferrimonas balearica]MBY5990928.1 PilZ domain-containing protein [Ferrimonas balearica]